MILFVKLAILIYNSLLISLSTYVNEMRENEMNEINNVAGNKKN